MRRILHALPVGYERPIVDLVHEELIGWDIELRRKDNDSGSLKLTIGSANPEFDGICTMRSEMVVMNGEREIWRGRVTEQRLVNHCKKQLVCKGLLDYLYDAVIKPQTFKGTAKDVLAAIIAEFNSSNIESYKHFSVGAVAGISDIDYELRQPTKCFKVLSSLVKEFGGSLKAYRDGENNVIVWRGEGLAYRRLCSQAATFGENISKMDVTIDGSDIATALVGTGKGDLLYTASDDEAIAQFGYIEDAVSFSQIEDAEELRAKTEEALQERITQVRSITASAIDLSSIDSSVEAFEEGEYVQLTSAAHGLYEAVLVNEIVDPIFTPSKMSITLGASLEAASNIMRRLT